VSAFHARSVSRTILIMAGGTGGHVFPGLAVADEMRGRGWNVVWMGSPGGLEARLVPARGYPVAWIRAAALRGKGLAAKLLLPLHLLMGFWQGAQAILKHRPDVVLGMGGYVAFPGGMMASLLKRPLAVHEQNAVAGLANRVLAGVADRKMVAFPEALAGAEWTGNPVRAEIAALAAPAARCEGRSGPLRLLVVGGSLGAQALNETVPKALALIEEGLRPSVLHQSGEKNLESLRSSYRSAGVRGELVAFVDDMARAYAEADLVICRAGAMTVAELAAGGVASVLVPYPHAVDDHQAANARFLAEQGAAILILQKDLSPEGLGTLLRSLDRRALLAMAQKARTLGKPDAARVVADRCVALAEGRPA
jgi:UDP-N-acetylglucosamine--N-acetylmuramyl-(pentapeptide) pyrophosphoryl-undecaprenol N-acetylglucosamine transferase